MTLFPDLAPEPVASAPVDAPRRAMPVPEVWPDSCEESGALLGLAARGPVQAIITSPPYWAVHRYSPNDPAEIGWERKPDAYAQRLAILFANLRDTCLTPQSTLWINLADVMNDAEWGIRDKSLPEKTLLGLPSRFLLAMLSYGFTCRSEIVWTKTRGLIENPTDRPTRTDERVFLFSCGPGYYFDAAALSEPDDLGGRRNGRNQWSLAPDQDSAAYARHPAIMPRALAQRCILAGTRPGDLVLDPFCGTGTTLAVAYAHGRRALGLELNPAYVAQARARLDATTPGFPL
jgi:site-specific DNA-methyltransferase (cytosine-N4-specific)